MRLFGGVIQGADRAVGRVELATEFFPQPPVNVIRQLHAGSRHGHDARSETGKRINKRVNSPAAPKIAGNRNLQIAELLVFFLEREEIAQRLRRMLVTSVTSVDDRN